MISAAAVIGSAVGAHDYGSTICPSTQPSLGIIRKTVAAAPAAPTGLSVAATCTGTCATTYTYCVTQFLNNDPNDQTQSACSTSQSVANAVSIGTSNYNTLTGAFTNCSTTTPCRVYETAPVAGFIGEARSSAAFVDKGIIPNGITPFAVGIIAPPVDLNIKGGAAPLGSSSAPGIVQCDGTTISCNGSGIISTAANPVLTRYSNYIRTALGSVAFAPTNNQQNAYDYQIAAQVTFGNICVYVSIGDATNLYGIALVNSSNTVLAHWGGVNLPAGAGWFCHANSEGSVSIIPGNYYVVTTGNSTTGKFAESSDGSFTTLSSASTGTSSGGVFGSITLSISGTIAATATTAASIVLR